MTDLNDVYLGIQNDPFWDYLRLPGINFVPGRGQRNGPKVLIVGEAPGATENARQKPFCGPSGVVLDHLMEAAGLRAEPMPGCESVCHPPQGCCGGPFKEPEEANAWITNVVKYRPPHNATPNLAAILHAKESLRAEWKALGGPKAIICVGSVAHQAIHPEAGVLSVGMARHAFHQGRNPETGARLEKGPWIISSYHPAYGLRKGRAVQEMMTRDWEAFGEMLRDMEVL